METQSDDASPPEQIAEDINQEQLFHDLEKRYVRLKSDFTLLESQRDTLLEENKALEIQNQEQKRRLRDAETTASDAKALLVQKQSSLDLAVAEKREAQILADRRFSETDSLRAEIKSLTESLLSSQKRETELQSRVADISAERVPLELQLERLLQEKDVLAKQNSWLETQLADLSSQHLKFRQQSSSRVLELESALTDVKEELSSCKKQLDASKQRTEKQQSAMQEFTEKIQEMEKAAADSEQQFHRELAAQARVASLYKEALDESSAKASRLENIVAQLRTSLESIEKERSNWKTQSTQLLQECKESTAKTIKELEDRNKDLARQLQEMSSPGGRGSLSEAVKLTDNYRQASVAAAEKYLRDQGYTLTDLVDRISELQGLLRDSQTQKEELELYIGQVLKEIEEKAPIIHSQRADYERALTYHEKLSSQLDIAYSQIQELKETVKRERDEREKHGKENILLRREVDDLAREIQHLLKQQIETRRGIAIGPSTPEVVQTVLTSSQTWPRTTSAAGVIELAKNQTAADAIITENLVTFNDIIQLQVRNQQLLKIVRQLSDDRERELAARDQIADEQMEHVFKVMQSELEELRDRRERQQEMLVAIVQQRDMYRVLLAQADKRFLDTAKTGNSQAVEQNSTDQSSEARVRAALENTSSELLRELQDEFDEYKREKRKNEQLLMEQMNKLRAEISHDKLTASQAQAEAKFLNQRYEGLLAVKTAAEEECSRLRAKNGELQSLILRHQKQNSDLDSKLLVLEDQIRSLSSSNGSLKAERDVHAAAEQRMNAENKRLRDDVTRLMKLSESVQGIERELQSRALDDRNRLLAEVAHLQKQNEHLRKTAEDLQTLQHQLQHQAAADIKMAQEKVESAVKESAAAKERAASSELKLQAERENILKLQKTVATLEARLTSLQSHKSGDGATSTQGGDADVFLQLRAAQQELEAATVAKRDMQEQLKQYKAVASANEKALAELSSASERWKAEQIKELENLRLDNTRLTSEVKKSKELVNECVADSNKLREEIDRLSEIKDAEITELKRQITALEDMKRAAIQRQEVLQKDMEMHMQAAKSAQENYERELQLHATDISSMSQVKHQCEELKSGLDAAQSQLAEVTSQMIAKESSWLQAQRKLEQLKSEAEEKCNDIVKQNGLLYSQLDSLTAQLRRVEEERENQFLTGSNTTSSPMSPKARAQLDADRTTHELRELVRHLRREKDICEGKLELVREESSRYQAQVLHLQTSLDRSRAELLDAVKRSENVSQVESEHAKLLGQVQQINLLRESNMILREENDRNAKRAAELSARLDQVQSDVEPLKKKISLAEAERDAAKANAAALAEANARWKGRVDQLVDKYHQIDPEAHANLQKELETVKQQFSQQLSNAKEQLAATERKFTTEIDVMKAENTSLKDAKAKDDQMMANLRGYTKTWKGQAEGYKKTLGEKTTALTAAEAKNKELEEQIAALREEIKSLKEKASTAGDATAQNVTAQQALQDEIAGLKKSLEGDQKEAETLKAALEAIKVEHQVMQKALEETKAETEQTKKLREEEKSVWASEKVKLDEELESEKAKKVRAMKLLRQHTEKIKELNKQLEDIKSNSPQQPSQSTYSTVSVPAATAESVMGAKPASSGASTAVDAKGIATKSSNNQSISAPKPADNEKTATKDIVPAAGPNVTPQASVSPTLSSPPVALGQQSSPLGVPPLPASKTIAAAELRRLALQTMQAKAKGTPLPGTGQAPTVGAAESKSPPRARAVSEQPAKSTPDSVADPSTREMLAHTAAEGSSSHESPFLSLNPPSATASSSPLVFGKPDIKLPVPISISPAASTTGTLVSPNSFLFESPLNAAAPPFQPAVSTLTTLTPSLNSGTKRGSGQIDQDSTQTLGDAEPVRKLARKEADGEENTGTEETKEGAEVAAAKDDGSTSQAK